MPLYGGCGGPSEEAGPTCRGRRGGGQGAPVRLGQALAPRDLVEAVQGGNIFSVVQLAPEFAVEEALVVSMQV